MAHYDCRNCGESGMYYPNCCKETQDSYIERQKEIWAEDKAKTQLSAKHKIEVQKIMEELLGKQEYENDKQYIRFYLKEIKPIRG